MSLRLEREVLGEWNGRETERRKIITKKNRHSPAREGREKNKTNVLRELELERGRKKKLDHIKTVSANLSLLPNHNRKVCFPLFSHLREI